LWFRRSVISALAFVHSGSLRLPSKLQHLCIALGYALFKSHTDCGLAKVAIFSTNVDAENQCLINHKCVCGALNRHFCQTAVPVAQLR
jgi:hypothetical protein